MTNHKEKAGELPAADVRGINRQVADLRANPKLRCFGVWQKRVKRSPLLQAMLRMRSAEKIIA